jgi:hypothetical protein
VIRNSYNSLLTTRPSRSKVGVMTGYRYLMIFLGGTLTSLGTDFNFLQTAALNLGILLIGVGASKVGEPWS